MTEFDDGVRRLAATVTEATAEKTDWLERVRAGVVALLGFLDDEPRWREHLIATESAGVEASRSRQQVLDLMVALLSEDSPKAFIQHSPSPLLTAELVVGGVFSVIHAQELDEASQRPLVELAPSLMAFVVVPYLGPAAARVELTGKSDQATDGPTRRRPLVRATHRTTLVLRAIASAPGSTNRDIALAAGLRDEGQTSKLLRRLQREGIIENVGLGASYGEPNSWHLTAHGTEVARMTEYGLAPKPRRRRGARGASGRGR